MEQIITARLLKNLEKFEKFGDSIVVWTFSVPEQRFIYISPNFESLTGYNLAKIYLNPKLWLEMIQNYETSKFSRQFDGDTIYFESYYSIKTNFGESIYVEETILPIFDEKDQLIHLKGFSKMKKENLTESKLVDDLKIPFAVLEKRNSKWIVSSISEEFNRIFNKINNQNNKSYLDNIIGKIVERIDEIILNQNSKIEIEVNNEEIEKYFQIDISYQKNERGNEKIFAWASDITDIKINEKRLQKLNNDKNKLLSIVSHDLKSPFNTILNFINLLNEGIEINEEQKKEYLKYIFDTAKQQLDLIHDLLDWSKIESGLLEFSPNYIQLNTIVGKIISGFSGQIYQKNLLIESNIDKELKVFFDKNYLKIVLSNIISNAIKFSHKNGKIIISAAEDEEYTTIIIQDFGIGFSQRYFKQITQSQNFELQIGTMGEKGTGLGLKFCYDIISSNYGKLMIESKSQKGTKVIIKLKNPTLVGVYFGEENEINSIKNSLNKYQPDVFLYLCKDVFDLLRFIEQTSIDVAFINLDVIKSFQKSFLERIFSEFPKDSKIIGFSDNPELLNGIQSILHLSQIEQVGKAKSIIIKYLKELLSLKKSDKFSEINTFHFNTEITD